MTNLVNVFSETNVSVRTVVDAIGEVWFSCVDVALAVGYDNPKNALSRLMPDRKELSEIELVPKMVPVELSSIFGAQWKQAKVINLEGVNDFLMDSGKPKAKAFRKWVTGTVLPSIQKTGKYEMQPATPESELNLSDEQVAIMLLNSIREKNTLAEQMGLLNWFTQAQIRYSNDWYGARKANIDLNHISHKLGYEVRTRAVMSSADIHNPTNMYHVEVFRAYAKNHGKTLNLPRESQLWNLRQKHLLQLATANVPSNQLN